MGNMLAQLTIHEPGHEHPVEEGELDNLRSQGLLRTGKDGEELVREVPAEPEGPSAKVTVPPGTAKPAATKE